MACRVMPNTRTLCDGNRITTVHVNDKTDTSIIADPYVNELDQLWISYAGIPDNLIKGAGKSSSWMINVYWPNVGCGSYNNI